MPVGASPTATGEGAGHAPSSSIVAIVVHYRTPAALARSLAALRAQTVPIDTIVVVDNSAHLDGPIEMGATGCTVLAPASNIGFGAACNLGAANTSSDCLLFVNPDLTLDREAGAQLMRAANAHAEAAVFAPRIYGRDGEVELSARRDPSVLDAVLGRRSAVTQLLRSAGRPPRKLAPALGGSAAVDWVSGACMLVRREAYDAVGGFDEAYWMYWEDADLCLRLRQAGWSIRFEPSASGRHLTSSSGVDEQTVKAFHASAARFYARHVARRRLSRQIAKWLLGLRCRLLIAKMARTQGKRRSA